MRQERFKNFIMKNELTIIIVSIVIFVVFLFFILISSYDGTYLTHNKLGLHDISSVTVVKEGGVEVVDLPREIDVNGEFDILLDISEYKDMANISIFSWFIYACADVYLDDNLIYSLDKKEDTISKSGAYAAVIFDLPNEVREPYLRIHISPTIENIGVYKIEKMVIGRKADIVMDMLDEDFFTILVSGILIINFIFSVILNIRMQDFMKFDHYALLHVSVVGLILAIYFLIQTKTTIYFLGNFREGIYFIEYTMLNIVLIPAILYIKYKVDMKFSKMFNILIFLVITNIIAESALTLFKIIEFKEMIYITHALILMTVSSVFIAIVFTDGKEFPSKKSLFFPVFAIIVTAIIPIIYYMIYKGNVFKNVGLLTVVALVIIEIHELYKKYFDYKKKSLENKIYKKLAITDSLTGLKNRQAHEEFIARVAKEEISGWILSIDINNLKYINDKFGHLVGDKLIVAFSEILINIEKDNKNINAFRIGGDEFFIFIEAGSEYDIPNLINRFKMEYNECNYFEDDFRPSFSAGYYYYDFSGDKSVMEIYNLADRRMYENKAKYKKKFRQEID